MIWLLVNLSAVHANWIIGKIIEVHRGKDGKVRNVTVKIFPNRLYSMLIIKTQ